MTIKNEKEYKGYEARVEQLIQRGTELGDMELQRNDFQRPSPRPSLTEF